MKKFLPLLLFTAGLLLTTAQLNTQGLPPCAKIFGPPDAQQNPDSVAVDTCWDSPTYDQLYARQWFDVTFDTQAVDLPWYPNGTVIDTTWEVVGTDFSSIREGLEDLEERFGTFILRKRWPADTLGEISQMFDLRFDSYVNIDSASDAINAIPNAYGGYIQRLIILIDAVPVDVMEEAESETFFLIPNPAGGSVDVAFESKKFSTTSPLIVHDALGRTVLQTPVQQPPQHTRLDLSALSAGAYFVRYGSSLTTLIVR